MNKAGEKGTVSIELVHEALQAAIARGIDVSRVLTKSHIDDQLLNAPKARIAASRYAALWGSLADLLDDEFFGMDSHSMRRGSFRLMCQASAGAETLEQALHRILRFLGLILDDFRGELRREDGFAVINLGDHGTMRRLFAYGTWFILVHGLACGLVHRRIPLVQLSFRASAPQDDSHYRTRFCQNLVFDAPLTQIRFDASYLNLKLLETPTTISTFVNEAPANLLVKYRNENSASALVRRKLRNQPPSDWPELDELARLVCMSGTTLQRRLQAEGTNYQRLKDDLRRDISIDLLSVYGFTVAEVTARIGFREPSAFHRAFKKWTGVSPGAYRRGPNSDTVPSP